MTSAPSAADQLVLLGGFDGSVYAVNAQDGTLAWSYDTGSTLGITSAPGIVNGMVLVGTQVGAVIALDAASGSKDWTTSFPGGTTFGPVVDDGMLWVTTAQGEVRAFGEGKSSSTTPAPVGSPSAQSSPPLNTSS